MVRGKPHRLGRGANSQGSLRAKKATVGQVIFELR